MRFSAGAVIKAGGKYLLIDRDMGPFVFAGIAGHIDEGEGPEEALARKVKEEGGMEVKKYSPLFEEEVERSRCRAGINSHYWYVYECEVEGDPRNNPEASTSIGWYAPDEIKKLKMEPVWK